MFDDLTDVYDALVDWPKRLANEAAFYRQWFAMAGVQSVVDVACGTGRHAAMFFGWGLRVEAADVSPQMIDRAQAMCGETDRLQWRVRGFAEPIAAAATFDAAICVGNSLALAPDKATVAAALLHMGAAVRPRGLLVVHVLNLWGLPDGPCVWQKCKRAALPTGAALVLKGVHRCGPQGYVDLAVADISGDDATKTPYRTESAALLGFEAAELEQMLGAAGATEIEVFGGYQGQPYVRETSPDLLLVGRK